jgi:hypothetical protein
MSQRIADPEAHPGYKYRELFLPSPKMWRGLFASHIKIALPYKNKRRLTRRCSFRQEPRITPHMHASYLPGCHQRSLIHHADVSSVRVLSCSPDAPRTSNLLLCIRAQNLPKIPLRTMISTCYASSDKPLMLFARSLRRRSSCRTKVQAISDPDNSIYRTNLCLFLSRPLLVTIR